MAGTAPEKHKSPGRPGLCRQGAGRPAPGSKPQIEQATHQALGQIRDEVAKLSLAAAEKITRKSLTGADQQRLIDEALAEIDFSQLEGSRS